MLFEIMLNCFLNILKYLKKCVLVILSSYRKINVNLSSNLLCIQPQLFLSITLSRTKKFSFYFYLTK